VENVVKARIPSSRGSGGCSLLLWDPKPRDLSMNSLNNSEEELGRNEPVIVAIIWEDLWIAVKCQSNVEIAGCLRKI